MNLIFKYIYRSADAVIQSDCLCVIQVGISTLLGSNPVPSHHKRVEMMNRGRMD